MGVWVTERPRGRPQNVFPSSSSIMKPISVVQNSLVSCWWVSEGEARGRGRLGAPLRATMFGCGASARRARISRKYSCRGGRVGGVGQGGGGGVGWGGVGWGGGYWLRAPCRGIQACDTVPARCLRGAGGRALCARAARGGAGPGRGCCGYVHWCGRV